MCSPPRGAALLYSVGYLQTLGILLILAEVALAILLSVLFT